jgi:hypothetical protein
MLMGTSLAVEKIQKTYHKVAQGYLSKISLDADK